MRNTTLLFLVRKEGDVITDICLAMKKRGFGAGRYNGVGGKVQENENIETAAIREAQEEIGVTVSELEKVAELSFTFPHEPKFDQQVHVYLATSWKGDITESEEMNPSWVSVHSIPYTEMWPDDIFWLPKVLAGEKVKGKFTFGEGDVVVEQQVGLLS